MPHPFGGQKTGFCADESVLTARWLDLQAAYHPKQWHCYMGPLILDPVARGEGLGRKAAEHVINEARADNAPCIRIAVLDVNEVARAFWAQMGFEHERTVKANQNTDGNKRHVLKLDLTGE